MKRAAILLAVGLMAGCSTNQSATTKPADIATSASPAAAFPSHEGEPTGLYFERRKDGKTYVTGYVSTANLVREGQAPGYLVEKPGFGPDGSTVVFEDDGKGLEQRLEKDYLAQHKK